MPLNKFELEVCIDDAAGLAACQGRADRIELCSALGVGGLTPSPGLIDASRHSAVPVHVMIRPRVGGFDLSAADVASCIADIHAVRAAGLAGVVLGATTSGILDKDVLAAMTHAAQGLSLTLHRAIDVTDDPVAAVGDAIALGFDRILTSGGALKAKDGIATLRAMRRAADGRIVIMTGSGVTPSNVADIADQTGITAFHASCSTPVVTDATSVRFGFIPGGARGTDASEINAMRAALDAIV
jgi:copper homeostasis protein